MNPLLSDWTAPFGLPPFGAIETAHFAPAFDAALTSYGGRERRFGRTSEQLDTASTPDSEQQRDNA